MTVPAMGRLIPLLLSSCRMSPSLLTCECTWCHCVVLSKTETDYRAFPVTQARVSWTLITDPREESLFFLSPPPPPPKKKKKGGGGRRGGGGVGVEGGKCRLQSDLATPDLWIMPGLWSSTSEVTALGTQYLSIVMVLTECSQ